MTECKDIITIEATPTGYMRQATDVAGVSREIVLKTARNIQGRKYVQVEGWQAIALAHGCVLSAEAVEKIEGGVRAVGVVTRMSDGKRLATAEGFVGDDEKMWAGRPMFARRAMAQTRAMSRAARSAFAHVVVMIDSGLSTTPAEEMDGIEAEHVPAPKQTPAPKKAPPAPLPVTTCPGCRGGKNPTESLCPACDSKEEQRVRAESAKHEAAKKAEAAPLAASAAQAAAEIKECRALFVAMGVKTTDGLKNSLEQVLGYPVEGSLTGLSNDERGKVLAELRRVATEGEKAAVNG
jgi:hypothetical protein